MFHTTRPSRTSRGAFVNVHDDRRNHEQTTLVHERAAVRLKHPDTLGAILERDVDVYRLSLNSDRSLTDIAFASRTQTAMKGKSKDFRVFRGRP